MKKEYLKYLENLSCRDAAKRLESLQKLIDGIKAGDLERPGVSSSVNNHIHTTYSFSPYTPSKAIWMAYNAGLMTAGIVDHDSVSGVREFIEAGKIAGIATTVAVECRVDFSHTSLAGRCLNNPDQKSIGYVVLHGIPHTKIDAVKKFFIPYSFQRNERNRRMVEKLNLLMKPFSIQIDFEKDIVSLSMSSEGGSITERHILFALSSKLIEVYGKGEGLIAFLKGSLEISISSKIEKYLENITNEFYEYDLLGVLKSEMLYRFYINADLECPDVTDVINFSNKIMAIPAYGYLGDVGESVTGDKKKQKFEDDYLELLFEVLKSLKFQAFTYMPSRNSLEQLRRVKTLCEKHGLFQISGEDINSPRQPLVCDILKNDEFKNLFESTWALIGHETATTENINNAMFSKNIIWKYPDLDGRVEIYARLGKGMGNLKVL